MTIYETLRVMVMAGDLPEGERVAESKLAEQLGVSRTPVREALQKLESEGLVVAQGRGVRARLLSQAELVHHYSARAGLEGWAVYQAALRVSKGEVAPASLAALNALAQEMHALTRNAEVARAAQANRAFHEAMVALALNPVIDATLSRWWDQIMVSTRQSLHLPERALAVHAEHERILHALRDGDAPAARAAVEAHALSTCQALTASP